MKKLLIQNTLLSKGKSLSLLSIFFVILFFLSNNAIGQTCTISAGGNAIVCASNTTLTATRGGTATGTPAWSFISGPVTPVISSPNTLITDVTGMTATGNYIFQVSQVCANSTIATSQVTITARPKPVTFTAGPDITNICATVGTTPLGGFIPAGFTGAWRAVNIFSLQRFGNTVSTNSQFSNTSVATPDFSLTNKANHTIDPSYYVILRITSSDNICSYEDTAIVRFRPNPNIIAPTTVSKCRIAENTEHFLDLLSTSPSFNTSYPGSSGTVAAGTNVTINVTSQPAGANMTFLRFDDTRRAYFSGMDFDGTYTFTITVTNTGSCAGTYTTPLITYTYTLPQPRQVNFKPSSHPEQYTVYSGGGSGGEVHCSSKIGTTTPENFYFQINPLDNASIITTSVTPSGVMPPGGAPTTAVSGAGLVDRVATVTPPAGGWRAGTYRFTVSIGNGSCSITQLYFIHVSDGNRPNVTVPDQTVCYTGTGAISATINLPAVYQLAVNSSYLQEFSGIYNLSVLSRPAGAAIPAYTTANLRSLTATQTTISNLDKAGDYVFRITADALSGSSVGPFLAQEYACSGTSLTSTFTIHVENLVNSNAGSDQDVSYEETATIAANSAGAGTGLWSWVSYPVGTSPVIVNPGSNLTSVTGLTNIGIYELAWTITSPLGGCVASDRVQLISSAILPVNTFSFDAIKSNKAVLLKWSTSTESNNAGFYIERSNGDNNWVDIGFVTTKAKNGNSNSKLDYSLTDNVPYQGINYYRLKQMDIDGKFEYSTTKQLHFGSSSSLIKLYPNPAKTEVTITGAEAGSIIGVKDALGKTVLTSLIRAQTNVSINISQLPKGIYLVIISGKDGNTFTRKLIKD